MFKGRVTIVFVEGDGIRRKDPRLSWAWIFVTVLGLCIVIILPFILLGRHHRLVETHARDAARSRIKTEQEMEQRRRVTGLLSAYLGLDAMAWRERDRTLTLILATAKDSAIKKWAQKEKERVAPYLKRMQIVQRYNRDANRLSLSQETAPAQETKKEGAPEPPPEVPPRTKTKSPGVRPPPGGFADAPQAKEARQSPHWRTYLQLRDRLRLRTGKYCCKIATGRLLFSRAPSIKRCRRLSQQLCDLLALTVGRKQKCFYTVTTGCDVGEVVAVGDVEGIAKDTKTEVKPK